VRGSVPASTLTESFSDPSADPATGVLRNLVGARTREALDIAESELCLARASELVESPPSIAGDLNDLTAIHRHLFQDVYAWAGQVRTVDIYRDESAPFLPVSFIPRAAAFCAEELQRDRMLRELGRQKFIERLAYHYDALNHIHPFREGNGRTQRVFWSQIAEQAGWRLDWTNVTGAVNDRACRVAADTGDLTPIREMFDQVLSGPHPD
jgi:cell filamentation protein